MNEPANQTTEPPKSRLKIYVGILIVLLLYVAHLLYYNLYYSRLSQIEKLGVSRYMEKEADLAVRLAQDRFSITLDYSPESVEQVEQILSKIYASRQRNHSPEENLSSMSYFVWGAYIGEVIKKLKGGTWHEDPKTPEITLQFELDGKQRIANPTFWCYQRVTKGRPEDNIWYKFLLVTVKPDPSQLSVSPPQQGVPGQ